MKRLRRIRILIVLIAFAVMPLGILPFVESIRSEWVRFWDPKEEKVELVEYLDHGVPIQTSIFPTTSEVQHMQMDAQTLTVPVESTVQLPDA